MNVEIYMTARLRSALTRPGTWLLVAAAVLLRLLAVPSALPDTDAVNFSLALERFDLARHQPHFPGYPLYVLVTRALHALGLDALWALALPGVLGAAALVALAVVVVERWAGRRAAVAAGLAIALDPLLVAVGGAPGSDGMALALFGCAFALVGLAADALRAPMGQRAPSPALLAGLLAGLALGVRPSYAAVVPSLLLAALLLARRARVQLASRALGGVALGTAAWLGPFVALVGPAALMEAARVHVAGHAERLGANVPGLDGADGALGLLVRAEVLGAQLAGSLAVCGALAIVALLLVGEKPIGRHFAARARLLGGALLVVAPYLAWVVLAQNVEHARHGAPIALALLVASALLVSREKVHADVPGEVTPLAAQLPVERRFAAALALAALPALWLTLRGPVALARRPPDAVAAVRWVAAQRASSPVLLLGQHVPRLATVYAPTLRTGLARTGADVRRIRERFPDGVTLLVTSELRGLEEAPPLAPLARFGALDLYEVRRDAGDALASATGERP